MASHSLAEPDDFPASQKCCYLNAASAALMYREAAERILAWQKDIADNGTMNFLMQLTAGTADYTVKIL